MVTLVDARNVLRSVWPNIPEPRLVELVAAWAREEGAEPVLVFDGRAPEPAEGVEVVGSGADSADEWIVRRAAELAAGGIAYALVTSDRELRAVAGRDATRTIGGGAFAHRLQYGHEQA